MKRNTFFLLAFAFGSLAFADSDVAVLNQALQDADQAYHSAENVHNDLTHNFGGHAGRAADFFKKAKQELLEAEMYYKSHPNQQSQSH